jgi:MGT family glycosyltransferase
VSSYLLASTPVFGHVNPMLRIAAHLVSRGHSVAFLTGSRFRGAAEAAGLQFFPLDGRADFDDRDADSYIPDRLRYSGFRRAQYEVRSIFIETIPAQAAMVETLVARLSPDAILVDGAFAGVLPLLSRSSPRPPVLAFGVTPLSQSSRDVAPYGMGMPPARSAVDRIRYAALGIVARRVIFRDAQRAAVRAVAKSGGLLRGFAMDASREFDVFLQTGPEALEYPRSDLSPNTRFVGIIPSAASSGSLPSWWDDLDGSRPVVHVTQGTIDNADFGRLVRPTLEALADRDCLVVVSTGGRDPEALGAVPPNARAERYLPYDALLTKTSVMVSNGGYGGVQAALAHGVPLVVAGDTEDKPEVAARVAWTGAGIDLKTATPTPDQIAAAVDEILARPSYRAAAERIAADASRHDALAEVEVALEAAIRR